MKKSRKVTTRPLLGAAPAYKVVYKRTNLYCPHCKKQAIWYDNDGEGDYDYDHLGCTYLCIKCGGSFMLPDDDANDYQIESIKQINKRIKK